MRSYDEMPYHPLAERVVQVIRNKTQIPDAHYLRVLVGYYFALAASQMRCTILTPDDKDPVPVNLYALALAPSGYGKTRSCNMLESEVLGQFRDRFLAETFPILAEDHLAKLANKRATQKQTDPDEELESLHKEFKRIGPLLFSFDSGTSPAIKQMRHKLLLANAGSMNLIMDEVGNNLLNEKDAFGTFIELYDKGKVKEKLIKNTNDNQRNEEIIGQTPSTLLMFGVPQSLLDGDKTEEAFVSMLDMGYARRCYFAYSRKGRERTELSPAEVLAMRMNSGNNQTLQEVSHQLETLADLVNANKRLCIEETTYLKLIEYQLDCEARAHDLPEHQECHKNELANRSFKALKLAGAYAFIDDSPEITEDHIYNAIRLTEDSGVAFGQIMARDKPHVKLAKYIASVGEEVTQADLAEDLPFYRGSASAKQDMMTLAIAYGYKNNIVIKKKFEDGIEFLRGESLKETDLTRMPVAYTTEPDMTTGYLNEYAPFDQLYRVTQANGVHWLSHHVENGYRNEDNAIAGFNYLVLDVDGTCQLSTAKMLLQDIKALYCTTKSHTESQNRYRIILPCNYELKLDAKDFREFYKNVLEWLPFEVDASCAHRCKKWLGHAGHYEYTEGDLFDVLPFIPKTSKNDERKKTLDSQQSMDNLERWVMNHIGDGNRNNMLLRYAMILVDGGFDFEGVRSRVMSLNDKIADKLDEAEIMGTVMVTAGKAIAAR